MAKQINCCFCGKEMVKGFFKGEDCAISLGGTVISCCSDCYDKYKSEVKTHHKRFDIKLANYKKSTKRKPSDTEIANMFKFYLNEYSQQLSKVGFETPDMILGCFTYNSKGYFSVREFQQGFANSDVSAKSMIKSMKKAQNTDCLVFDKNDITKIEYIRVGIGDPLGLFSVAYSYDIRLNDENVMTYKPCITRTAVLGKGFGFGYRRSAEKKLVKELNTFKQLIGSDLPITKGKK